MSKDRALAAAHHRAIGRAIQSQDDERWRDQKSIDLVEFNRGAEQRFVHWLTTAIRSKRTHTVGVQWTYGNAAFDLDLSPATIKRYLMKYSADAAPFQVSKGQIRLRHRTNSPLIQRNNTP